MSPSSRTEPAATGRARRPWRGGLLRVWLDGQGLRLAWQAGWPSRRHVAWQQAVPTNATGADDRTAAAPTHAPLLAALAAALRDAPGPIAGSRVQVRLAPGLAQLGVLRGDLHSFSQAAMAEAAQRWFARQLDTDGAQLRCCAVPQADGRHLLVGATDKALVAGLQQVLAEAGLRLVSARPALVQDLLQAERRGRDGLLARTWGLHLQLAHRRAGAWTLVSDDDLDQARDLPDRVHAFGLRCGAPTALAQAAVQAAASGPDAGEPGAVVRPEHRPFSAGRLDFCPPPQPLGGAAAGLLAAGVLVMALVAGLWQHGLLPPPAPRAAAGPSPASAPVRSAVPALPAPVVAGLHQVQAELRNPWLTALAPLAAVEAGGVQLLAVEPDLTLGRIRLQAWAPDALAMTAWLQRADAAHGAGRLVLDGWQPGRDAKGVRFALQLPWPDAPMPALAQAAVAQPAAPALTRP